MKYDLGELRWQIIMTHKSCNVNIDHKLCCLWLREVFFGNKLWQIITKLHVAAD